MACVPWPLPTVLATLPSHCTSFDLFLLAFCSLNVPDLLSARGVCTCSFLCPRSSLALSLHGCLLHGHRLRTAFLPHVSYVCSPPPASFYHVILLICFRNYLLVFDQSTSLEERFQVIFLFTSLLPVPRTVSAHSKCSINIC